VAGIIRIAQSIIATLSTLEQYGLAPLRRIVRQPGLGPAVLVSLALGVTVFGGVALIARNWPAPRPATLVAADEQWRYLLLCESCGYRIRTLEHPGHAAQAQDGLYRCQQCGALRAACYRRGSQTVPPDGW
jgi:hypothetical protein